MSILGGNDVIFLLGAGASKEAGLKTSVDMIRELEAKLRDDWPELASLYHCIKSSIFYAYGIQGDYDSQRSFNIERLVNTMRELEKNEEHTIYPFIASWNIKLAQLSGRGFEHVRDLRLKILRQLVTDWVHLALDRRASYFERLANFQSEWTYPLQIFSLNYDLCVEAACANRCRLERGFDEQGNTPRWNWRILDDQERTEAQIYLYKMHGSLDWRRENDELTYLNRPSPPSNLDDLQLIFGTDYKLSYIDPYLYCVYSFRRYTLDAKLLVTIGYGFTDEHINGILRQAMRQDKAKRLLLVTHAKDKDEATYEKSRVANLLGVDKDQVDDRIIVEDSGAKKFLEQTLTKDFIQSLSPRETGEPF